MRIVLQRVEKARVIVAGEEIGSIGLGILALVAIENGDDESRVRLAAEKLVHLRIFEDSAGKMNLDLRQVAGDILVVSQFTLASRLAKGRRPSFDRAAPPAEAAPMIDYLCREVERQGVQVRSGRFGADMRVELINDGPVTFVLDL